jgi:hypothetical protein
MMKSLRFILIFVVLLSNNLIAQIQTWPPGGITAGPMQFILNANRIIPSTKRYNLIWADQLYGLPQNKIKFVAQNYTGTQKIFDYQANDYRLINPNFLVISYHLANGLNPQHNDDCPDPKTNTGSGYIGVVAPNGFVSEWNDYFVPSLNSNSIVPGTNRFEQMFQHYDTADMNHRVWHIDPFWNMNLENADWRTYMGDNIVSWMAGNENEGAFLDVSVETMVSPLYNPNSNNQPPNNFNWYIAPHGPAGYSINTLSDFAAWMNDQYLRYYQYLYQRFHTAVIDYLIMPNVDQMVTGWYDPFWIDGDSQGETIDGAMMENFGSYTGSDMYLSLERGLRHITGRGKILISQFSDTIEAERYRRTGMYMLIKNENSFLCIHPGSVDWYPEYEIDLGDQRTIPPVIDSLRVMGTGTASLFRRDFDYGMVLCNTSSSPFTYPLTGNWQVVSTSGGGAVDTSGLIASENILYTSVTGLVTVNGSDCVILKNNSGTNISNSPDSPLIKLFYTEDAVQARINFENKFTGKIYLTDIIGKIINEIYKGELSGDCTFQIGKRLAGTYLLILKGNFNRVEKVIF